MKAERLYQQIYKKIKEDISTGKLKAGEKLPSRRRMADRLQVSVNTIDAAYGQLVSEGFIRAKERSGYYVCQLDLLPNRLRKQKSRQAPADAPVTWEVDFSTAAIESGKFPYSVWRRLVRHCLEEEALFEVPAVQGFSGLREEVADYLYRARNVHCSPAQIVIGAGTDHILQILSYLLDNAYTVAFENPVYHQAYRMFHRMGHEILHVPVDDEGISVEKLRKVRQGAVYVTPSHQFPLGISMPIRRRLQLLNWADGKDRYIIEDDYDSEFRYGSKPIPPVHSIDVSDSVIYLGTFSRVVAPALRISYMVLPQSLLRIYQETYLFFRSPVSGLEQQALALFMREGHFERHIARMRTTYRNRRDMLISALRASFGEELFFAGESAGHHLLVRKKGSSSGQQLCEKAALARVKVYPLSPYFVDGVPDRYSGYVILGYGGLSPQKLLRGAELLAKAWL